MVHREAGVVDVRICSLSFQRHQAAAACLVNQKQNTGRSQPTYCQKRTMGSSNPERQSLPLVELRPFSKKVWRREKSLPDFYEKHPQEEKVSSKEKTLEIEPTVSREVMREWEESKRSLESRQNTVDLNPCRAPRSHPKAEFYHDPSRLTWRPHDLIPSFITRLERTRTTLDSLHKENGIPTYRFSEEIPNGESSMKQNGDVQSSSHLAFGVSGGKMNKKVSKRHLLYLNPIDAYRQPGMEQTGYLSHQNSAVDKASILSRNSFPMTSSRVKELALLGSHHYPLRPIRTEFPNSPSPHKFNSKLGAAKNSLLVLSKWGVPTKLERNLEKEYEMNLERFRKERFFLPADIKNISNQYVTFDTSPTLGEMSLRQAREANKPKVKGNPAKRNNRSRLCTDFPLETRPISGKQNGTETSAAIDLNYITTSVPLNTFVNPSIHPLDKALIEESESRTYTDVNLGDVIEEKEEESYQLAQTSTHVSKPSESEKSTKKSLISEKESTTTESGTTDNESSSSGQVRESSVNDDSSSELTSQDSKSTTRTLGRSKSLDQIAALDFYGQDTTRTRDFTDATTTDRDGARGGCFLDTSVEISESELSPAARAKTNLEYLHNLRLTKGLPLDNKNTDINKRDQVSSEALNHNVSRANNGKTSREKSGDSRERLGLQAQTSQISTHIPSQTGSAVSSKEEKAKSNDQGAAESQNESELTKATGPTKNVMSKPNSVLRKTDGKESKGNDQNVSMDTSETNAIRNVSSKPALSTASAEIDKPKNNETSLDSNGGTIDTEVDDGIDMRLSEDIRDNGEEEAKEEKNKSQKQSGSFDQSAQQMGEDSSKSQLKSMTVDMTSTRKQSDGNSKGAMGVTGKSNAGLAVSTSAVMSDRQELTPLDSSMDPLSDADPNNLSTSADNGDSGVSTTFLTADDSRSELLAGLL